MATTSKQNNDGLISVGIDIGKEVFHLVGFNAGGKIVLRRKIKRLLAVSTCRHDLCSAYYNPIK